MSYKLVCDVCGEEIKYRLGLMPFRKYFAAKTKIKKVNDFLDDTWSEKITLCEGCMDAFIDFVKEATATEGASNDKKQKLPRV